MPESEISFKRFIYLMFGIIAIAIALSVVAGIFAFIPAGHRGVLLTWGAVEPVVMGEGMNFKLPIAQSVVIMSVQTEKYVASASAASKDLQVVSTEVTLNYRLMPTGVNRIYQELSDSFQDRIIQPAIQESVKASTAHYTAEELITKRDLVKNEIEAALKERVEKFGDISVQSVSITNFDFSDEFNRAIESKVTAVQMALKAENDLKRIQVEAEQQIAKAKGNAEAIKTEAEGKAMAIRIEAQALKENAQLISLRYIEKWNGQLPQFMTGDSGLLLSLPVMGKE